LGYCSRIKADAAANPEAWNATSFRLLEDRNARNREQVCKLDGCESVTDSLDLIGQRQDLGHD
jgi:hypothetical protein